MKWKCIKDSPKLPFNSPLLMCNINTGVIVIDKFIEVKKGVFTLKKNEGLRVSHYSEIILPTIKDKEKWKQYLKTLN